ncbi:MAG: DUF1508 domain-containing protein [Clostridiales bacterium]|nr:DUF1508 domain-containing protein [Clostridiales bacterium]
MFDMLIEYCKNEPFHLWTVVVPLALIVVFAIALMITASKKERAQAKEILPPDLEAETVEPTEEKPQPTVQEKTALNNTQRIPAPTVEENTEQVTEEKPKRKTNRKPKTELDKDKEKTMLHDELKDINTDLDFYEEDISDRVARYSGKWVICRIVTQDNSNEEIYFFELHASNGERLLSSEEYTTYNGALRGIETHKNNILKDNFRITLSKKGDYVFKLLNGKNVLLCMGEHYATRARCESAIESTKRFAKTAFIDENVQDHVVKVPVENNAPFPTLPDGYNGKWIIDCKISPDGDKVYFFELFANNGERLLSSEEYTTYIGAVNGIHTHKTNIQKGNFRISLTKHGDYIYKLLNSNNQLLCLGEHYKNKRACQNAIESVKRFALNSPILTDPALTK